MRKAPEQQRSRPEAGSAAGVSRPERAPLAKSKKSEPIPLVPAPGPADRVWNDYFRTHTPAAPDVCDVVLRLHKEGRTEDAIACLEGALLNGQSQPWMYTVLALEMEKAGRPREEVERVLLSNVDFSAVNVSNLLYSAAFLTRFGAKSKALSLYEQASRVDPSRLEPYVMGLKLARESDEPKAVIWAASGILMRAWHKDHEMQHREAEGALRDLEARLRAAGRTDEADRTARGLAEALSRDLLVELSWSGKADLDLLVEEPSGTICSVDNPSTKGGGVFVHDGVGADQQDTFDKYVCPQGQSGEYRAIVRYVSGDAVGKRAVLRIVRYLGTPREIEERFTVQLSEQDKVIRFSLQQGRLKELGALPLLKPAPVQLAAGRRGRRPEFPNRAGAEFVAARERQFGGPGAPGFQPVITVLSEGVTNSAMAVVSGDRRYVRLTLQPVFSAITDVFTFSFVNSGNPNGGGNR